VNISSIPRNDFYPTPELKNILTATQNLSTEVTLHWEGERNDPVYRRVIENLEAIRESLTLHTKEIYGKEQALMPPASTRLTEKQRQMLSWLGSRYHDELVYTVLIDRLSWELGMPRSTARWNLRGLREAGLIDAGNRENKGIPVSLTSSGQLLAEYLGSWIADSEQI